jgi:hypothetical protein
MHRSNAGTHSLLLHRGFLRASAQARAEARTPSPPLRARQVPQQEHAAYSLPIPNRQLTKRDLGAYDFGSLNAIEAAANSVPYLGNVVYRNDLILDTELRTSNILTHFFVDRGVAELQPGFNLLRDERAWERVSDTVFFNAIRIAWNNFGRRLTSDQRGSSSAQTTVRSNADVVWLENWYPTPFLDPKWRFVMTFYHAEFWDIRARARKLQQLYKWQEKGAVVERWVENCASAREPSRLALRKYIREYWLRELERQNAIKPNKPGIADQWQPPAQNYSKKVGSAATKDPSASPWT